MSDWRGYDGVADLYGRIHAPRMAEPARDLVALVEPGHDARILDIGAGLGESSVYFALRGARVTAVDISPRMIELAHRLARAHGVEVVERAIMPDELEKTDEVFLSGTAAEVTPVSEIGPHHYQVGPLTRTLMDDYGKLVRGAAAA